MGIWDHYEKIYEKLWVQKVSLGPTRARIIKRLKELEVPFESVLDMGCGTGQLLEEIREQIEKTELTGVEPSKLGNVAREKGLHIVTETVQSYKSPNQYDVVLCSHSFPYYENQREAVGKLMDLTKPGGYLMIANACCNTAYDKLCLSGVKLTTSKAHYPSENEMRSFFRPYTKKVEVYDIHKAPMPSIQLFMVRKETK